MIALIKKEMFNDRIREILSFVPSAIFPAIIAMVIGIFSRSIIATIFSGLASYWFLIFVV